MKRFRMNRKDKRTKPRKKIKKPYLCAKLQKMNKRNLQGMILMFGLLGILFAFKPNFQEDKTNEHAENEFTSPFAEFARNYERYIAAHIDSSSTVGAALSIVKNDTVFIEKAYGLRKAGTRDSVNVNTVFRLASVSKGFAGVLAALLDEEGSLNLNDNIVKHLPYFSLNDSTNTVSLSLKHTLSHTSGLVPHAFDNLVEANQNMEEIFMRLHEVAISAKPGQLYGYQNTVFSIIDLLIQKKLKKEYAELLEEKLFEPLEMQSASASPLHAEKDSNIAFPHLRRLGRYKAFPLSKTYYNVAPAAGVNASISDMSKWLLALLGNNSEILSDSVRAKISEPIVKTPLKRRYTARWDELDDKYYGLGWRIYHYKGLKILYHGGYVRGYRAEISFCPEENTGMVFLQNSPNYLASQSVPDFWKNYVDAFSTDHTETVK